MIVCMALVAPSCSFLLLTDGLILMPFLSISFVGRLGKSDMAALLRKVKAKQFIISPLSCPYCLKNSVSPLLDKSQFIPPSEFGFKNKTNFTYLSFSFVSTSQSINGIAAKVNGGVG